MTVRLTRGIEIASIAKAAGFDSIYIDLEHSAPSLETTSQICIAALEAGIAPFVARHRRSELIQRVLDGGALGIIAPDIRTADEARAVVQAAKYPPHGRAALPACCRIWVIAACPRHRPTRRVNEATMVIVQFESAGVDRALRGDFCRRGRRHGIVRHQ